MRTLSIVLACLASVSAAASAADQLFPYTAYVNSRDVYVRSGPGRDYYPTEKLQRGTPVEVYRHDPGGWYAIRPTEDSYSWISSRYVKPVENGLGEITRDKVTCRVGSAFSNVRDVIQVRLNKGELVELREEVNLGGQTWHKVSPPAGEFRWISGQYVDRDKPNDGVSNPRRGRADRKSRDDGSRRQVARASHGAERDVADETDEPEFGREEERPVDKRTSEPGVLAYDEGALPIDTDEVRHVDDEAARAATWEQTDDEAVNGEADDDSAGEFVDGPSRGRRGGVERAAAWREVQDEPNDDSSGDRDVAFRSRGSSARPSSDYVIGDFDATLKQIDIELSRMVSEEPTVWQFDELNGQLTAMLEQASTALERGRARRVLSKIARFEDIQSRYNRINQLQANTDRLNQGLDASLSSAQYVGYAQPAAWFDGTQGGAAASGYDALDGHDTLARHEVFDAVGVLRAVISRRDDAPHYAVVDERDDVLSFLTPAPGLNLQPHLGHRIGVTGTRGYMPEYNRPHVMVQRLTALDKSDDTLRQ